MPRYPGARWEPITGHTDGAFRKPILGVVLHVNDGSPSSATSNNDLFNFMQASSGSGAVSCHFQVGKGGVVWQYIDTNQTAWCQGAGNAQYLSIETQGLPNEPATPQQVQAIGELLRWLNVAHGIPLQLAEKPGQAGFGWHGMGAANGANWGHAACPGVRKDQRGQMLMVARALSPSGEGTPIGDDMPTAEDLWLYRVPAGMPWGGQVMRDILVGGAANSQAQLAAILAAVNNGNAAVSTAVQAVANAVHQIDSPDIDVDEAALATQLAADLKSTLPASIVSALGAALQNG